MSSVVGSTVLKLNNDFTIPVLGLGTWTGKPGDVKAAIETAISVGYRHIDCSPVYQNEDEVGQGLKTKIDEGVKREEIFVTSKLWNTEHAPKDVRPALMKTLKDLQLGYIDLYLIHWPLAFKAGKDFFPKDELGNFILTNDHYTETWKEMEKLVQDGLVKSIGLSNFNSKQIQEIWEMAKIKPAVLQSESHPYLAQKKLIDFCKEKGIVFTAYSPLGSRDRPWAKPEDPVLLEDPKIAEIAKKYSKSTAQICIKWQIERGVTVIPKSFSASRIQENANIFDFKLAKEDIAAVESVDRNFRGCVFPITANRMVDGKIINGEGNHPFHPFINAEF